MLVHSSALLMSALPFFPCGHLYLIWSLAFHRKSQPSLATKLMCHNFLAKSSAFSLNRSTQFLSLTCHSPNHNLRAVSTSGAFPLRRCFNFVAGLWPWQKTSHQRDLSSSSLLISLVRMLLGILKISASSLWLELGGYVLILSNTSIFSCRESSCLLTMS